MHFGFGVLFLSYWPNSMHGFSLLGRFCTLFYLFLDLFTTKTHFGHYFERITLSTVACIQWSDSHLSNDHRFVYDVGGFCGVQTMKFTYLYEPNKRKWNLIKLVKILMSRADLKHTEKKSRFKRIFNVTRNCNMPSSLKCKTKDFQK